jgi:hypothetical protein
MEARQYKKQLQLRGKQLECEAKQARQNDRYEQELTREVAKQQTAKRLVVNSTRAGGASKNMRRAQRELRLLECYNQSSVQSTCEVGFLDFRLKEQPSDDTVVTEEHQEQQHKGQETDFGCEHAGLVGWLMAPLTWMVAQLKQSLNLN